MQSSTLRSAVDPTITESSAQQAPMRQAVKLISYSDISGKLDLVAVLQEHPSLLSDRSHLMSLVCEEYTTRAQALRELDLDQHCRRFEQFGSSIRRTIQRQLEVLRFIDVRREPPKWPLEGENFGQFRVIEELGRGAIARVYLCLDEDLGHRPVAVKVTPVPSFEASILGQLNHENIIQLYSTGFVEEWDLSYLCMPYRGRSTLADLADLAFQFDCPRRDTLIKDAAQRWTSSDNWLPKNERSRSFARFTSGTYVDGVLQLAIQIADALDHAHRQKILHGDLKPSNILLTPSGIPLLLDFNLSRDDAGQLDVCGGTLPYMPPEQLYIVAGQAADNASRNPDAASDIYSFGALLYELLTGVTPFHCMDKVDGLSKTAKLLLARIQTGAPSIRQYNRFVSTEVEAIVIRCLNHDPRQRPTTMAEVKRSLEKERKLFAVVRRKARTRPILYSSVVGLALLICSALTIYIAVQPPQYLANYEEGLRLASSGSLDRASEYFASSSRYNPTFTPAKFQLGRMRLAQGEIDLALNEFQKVLKENKNDTRSMAYVGYCFNLKRLSVAAIPWYELAVQNGDQSVAVYNNLGASYLDGTSSLTRAEQLRRSELYLLKALAINSSSPVIQLNIVRHAVTKSTFDNSYDPTVVWRHAKAVIASAPNDRLMEKCIASWYQSVLSHEESLSRQQARDPLALAEIEPSARIEFAEIYGRIRSRNPAFLSSLNMSDVSRNILEPISSR